MVYFGISPDLTPAGAFGRAGAAWEKERGSLWEKRILIWFGAAVFLPRRRGDRHASLEEPSGGGHAEGVAHTARAADDGSPETTDVPAPALPSEEPPATAAPAPVDYILNQNTGKFHVPSCPSVEQMKGRQQTVFQRKRERR